MFRSVWPISRSARLASLQHLLAERAQALARQAQLRGLATAFNPFECDEWHRGQEYRRVRTSPINISPLEDVSTPMEAMSLAPPRDHMPERGGSLRGWLYAVGLVGLAIAVASIADMFSARPNDGIVPIPYRTGGIEVRSVAQGGPAQQAGITSGDCVLGIGSHLVKSISDASRELRRHRIGETVPYLVRRGPCVIASSAAAPEGEMRTVGVRLSSIRLGGMTTVYTAVLGFLFFFIGLFVFQRRPDDRAAQVFFLLCVLFMLFFVCRLRPSSYWWIDVFVQNTGTVSLFLLPAVFLHFFLIFPRPKRLTFAKADEWSEEPPARWKVRAQEFLSASPGLLYLIYSIPPVVFLYDVFRQLQGHHVSILSGAPLSSWVLLGDYLILGILALAHSAFTLEDPGERRQAFHVLVGTILGTTPFVLLGVVLPSLFNNDDYVFYGIVPMILIPLTFAYAIVRFQMMNIRLVVKRTFLYAGTTAILFGLYIAAIATANALFARRLSASPLFNFGFFLVVVPLFELVRRRLQTPLDKLFFREKFDYQAALLEMSEAITGELDLGKITDYLTASVAATMRLERASIWLRDKDGFLERRGRRDDRVSPDAGVRSLLRREGKPVALDELSLTFSDPESRDFRERLEAEGFRLVVPLVYRERLMGVLALKEKLSGERFDREDRALLSTLANQAALAIETALLHDEMTRQAEFRRDLEIARDIQSSLLPRSVPDRAGLHASGRQPPGQGRRRRLLRLHSFRGPVPGRRDRGRLGKIRSGLAPDGRLQGDRLLPRPDDPGPRSPLPGIQPPHLLDQAEDVRLARLLRAGSRRHEPSLRDRRTTASHPSAVGRRRAPAPGSSRAPASAGGVPGGPLRHAGDLPEARRPDLLLHRRLFRGHGRGDEPLRRGEADAISGRPEGGEPGGPRQRDPGRHPPARGRCRAIRRHDVPAPQGGMRPGREDMPETRERSGRIMKTDECEVPTGVALVAVVFLLVAGGLTALYLTSRREVTTSSAAAYRAYQDGVENDRRFYKKEAQVSFARALALDPNFAMAMLRLANAEQPRSGRFLSRAGWPAARAVDRAGAPLRGHGLRRRSGERRRAQQTRAGDLREVSGRCRRRHDSSAASR